MIIYLDFDGTVVEHKYPIIGKYNEGCFDVLKKLINSKKHKIILNTYRSNLSYIKLMESVDYLNLNGFKFNYTKEKIDPLKWDWDFMKKEEIMFIDDIAEKIPMKNNMVDWFRLDEEFIKNKIY